MARAIHRLKATHKGKAIHRLKAIHKGNILRKPATWTPKARPTRKLTGGMESLASVRCKAT